jgi:hemerythrin
MALIEWREEFCTGISGVDYEHEKLIHDINSVYASIDAKADQQSVVDSLGDIYGSISAHFALEEQMMKRHGYDQYQAHMADHNRLLDEIVAITDELENSSELNNQALKQKLTDWFGNHFKTHDSRLHNLEKLMSHDQVDRLTMKSLLQKGRRKFFSQTSSGS